MTQAIALLLGAALSLGLVLPARTYPPRRERRVYTVGLGVAAILYVAFGAVGGAGAQWLPLESLGVILYGAAAWGGLRDRHYWLLALGWAAHVAWDVTLHLDGAGANCTPRWYPWFCVSFDLSWPARCWHRAGEGPRTYAAPHDSGTHPAANWRVFDRALL